ncbi:MULTISPECIES: hypothetical protein [unclassified Burkholderia]|uniref:hypothetical protein n=1 Tax=unclassified Burkholderia TaxID=2613784 RepID=UPI001E3C10E3|nr:MULTISPECIES: hypothetical protein [unclassified Burkholderia]UEP32462.1 hypothetical protein LMA01_33990 [Burkholderia sp. B21-007]UEP46480.1 hypothetical protein LMA02_32285 [Burkholderia sp. B21-005]
MGVSIARRASRLRLSQPRRQPTRIEPEPTPAHESGDTNEDPFALATSGVPVSGVAYRVTAKQPHVYLESHNAPLAAIAAGTAAGTAITRTEITRPMHLPDRYREQVAATL